jgi:hypothetical protein
VSHEEDLGEVDDQAPVETVVHQPAAQILLEEGNGASLINRNKATVIAQWESTWLQIMKSRVRDTSMFAERWVCYSALFIFLVRWLPSALSLPQAGHTKGGSINVTLTSCLTGLELTV